MKTIYNRALPMICLLLLGVTTPAMSQVLNELTDTDVNSTYVDPEGRTTAVETGAFGQVLGGTDAVGLTTSITSDSNGNPLSISEPSGAVTNHTFDGGGNELTRTDQTLSGTTRFSYESEFSNITQITDPLAGQLSAEYDSNGNMTRLTTPEGRQLSFAYQSQGILDTATNTLGTLFAVSYNSDLLPVQYTVGAGPAQRQIGLSYTAAGQLDVATDPVGRTLDLDYDVMGRVIQATLPDSRALSYSYDVGGNLATLIPPGRTAYGFSYNSVDLLTSETYPAVTGGGTNAISYAYNLARELTTVTRADGINVNYAHDDAGRLLTVSQPNGDYTYSYGAGTGLLDSIVSPDGITQSQSYDDDLLTQVSWSGPVSGSVGYEYDIKGRLSSLDIAGQSYAFIYDLDNDVTQAGAQTFSWDAATGLLTSTSLGVINESFSHNEFAEVTRHTVTAGATTLYDVSYVRDRLARITQKVETITSTTVTTDYTYDLAGRLESVREGGALVATYAYDSNDNRTDNGASYDAQDRITARTGITYGYNAQGERIQKIEGPSTTQYQYDALGTLIGATLSNGDQIDYLLDGQSRRVARQLNGVTTEAWLYEDEINPVAQLNASNAVEQRYIYALPVPVPVYIEIGATAYKVVADHLGSVRLIVDASDGAIVQRIDYDAWGEITSDNNPGFQPFAYAGGLYDSSTALTHFGLREYDAQSSHWTSKDPIGFFGSLNNLYSYVSSEPINSIDPTGADGFTTAKNIAIEFAVKLPFNLAAGSAFAKAAGADAAAASLAAAEAEALIGATAFEAEVLTLGAAFEAGGVGGGTTAGITTTVPFVLPVLAAGIGGAVIGHAIEPHVRSEAIAAVGGEYDVAKNFSGSLPENALSERTLKRLRTDPTRRLGPRNQRRSRPAKCD